MKIVMIVFFSLVCFGCSLPIRQSSFTFLQSHDLNKFCGDGAYLHTKLGIGIFSCENGALNNWSGLPAVQFFDGTFMYFSSGKLHRKNGPAIEWADGKLEYYSNGKRHNENGPAVMWPDGPDQNRPYCNGTQEYWINGIQYTEKEYFNNF